MAKFGYMHLLRGVGLLLGLTVLTACYDNRPWHETALDGALPQLSFQMIRASDDKPVTAKDYLGKVVVLEFGYTHCTDVCPTTLANLSSVLDSLGAKAGDVRILFVTVDPNRDTVKRLTKFTGFFAPQVEGLRGSDQALAALAKRYLVSYSVTPASADKPYDVTHGAAVYVFDQTGKSRLLVTGLSTPTAKIRGLEIDIRRLLNGGGAGGWWGRMTGLFS